MRIKSYFSGTVESAMELASRELGDEAVILNSRPAPAEARHLGAYEVVFGVDETFLSTSPCAPGLRALSSSWSPSSSGSAATSLLGSLPPSISGNSGHSGENDPGPGPRGHRFELLEGEIVALRQELRKMSRSVLAPASHWKGAGLSENEASFARTNREAQELVAYLVQRDLPEGAAGELVRRGRERLRKGTRGGGAGTVGGASRSGDGWRREDVGVGNPGLGCPGVARPGVARPGTGRGGTGRQEKGLFSNGSGVFPALPGVLAGLFADESPLAAAVLDELAAVLRVDATLGRHRAARVTGGHQNTDPNPSRSQAGGSKPTEPETKVVALVGGAGVGKTTTLVKLAAHYGLRARRPTHIISTDNLRVGAAEQLRSYAAILGVGFDLAETAVALGQLLNEHASKDLILIDTPGLSPGQMEDGAAVARFLGTDPRVDCHLVVPAYQKGADVTLLLERFHAYGASKVILTRLDETEAIGGLLLALDESEARISFLSMGQTIPEDLEPASVARLLDLFVGDPPMGAFLMARESGDREGLRFDDRRADERGPDGLRDGTGARDEVERAKGRPEHMATAGPRR